MRQFMAVAAFALTFEAAVPVAAQEGAAQEGAAEEGAAQEADAAPAQASGRNFSFVIMPIPVSDPSIGNGLALASAAFYRAGGASRPWTTAVGALYTDTESYAAFAGQKAYLAGDRVRVTAGVGAGVFNVDFYGIGQAAGGRGRSIPIEQKGEGGLAEVLVRVAPNLYVGPRYRLIDLRTSINLAELPFPDLQIPEIELRSRSSALGLSGEYDTRDSEFQPSKGLYGSAQWLHADEAFGSDFNYDRVEIKLAGYHRLEAKSVLAWRGSTCWAGSRAPFYDICNFGSQNDLRGYVSGQYRDHAMYAMQAEYRRHLFWRFGAVAFAGVGGVAPSFDEMSKLLPAAGLGLRIQASKKYGVNAAIDYAWGDDSQALYFSIGEAF
jgi:outer membrane protein assembly factor BamA